MDITLGLSRDPPKKSLLVSNLLSQPIQLNSSQLTNLLGDSFTIGPSATRAFKHWPKLAEENEKIAFVPDIAFYTLSGDRVTKSNHIEYRQDKGSKKVPGQLTRHWRPQLHGMLLKQLYAIGISVEYGCRAMDYFEEGHTGRAGITLENGCRMEADVVIAADGLRSHSTKVTLGQEIRARPTGQALYRTAFPVELAMADPMVRERFPVVGEKEGPIEFWAGYDHTSTKYLSPL